MAMVDVIEKIRFTVGGISHTEAEGGYAVLLESDEQAKRIPIHVGINEGQAITLALEAFESPRPSTHNLLLNIIRDMRCKLKEILIDRIFEGIFFAKLILNTQNQETIEIDARPSDALVLAILTHIPIYITSEIVELTGINVEKDPDLESYKEEEKTEFYGMSIQDLEKDLQKTIQREEYEEASKIRDRINFLSNKK